VSEAGAPVGIPQAVLDELESVQRYTRTEVLDIPTLRYVAMETGKPALVMWLDEHPPGHLSGVDLVEHAVETVQSDLPLNG